MDEKKIRKLAMKYGLKCDPKNQTLEKQADIRQGFIEGMKQALNFPVVMSSAPDREFEGTLKTYSGFTHSNRNILEIEVAGQENYIGNVLKKGSKVNIQHWE